MNVRTLCLAILYFGEATGYEIRKLSIDGKYRYFVDASFGSIYPALNRLEKDGLVTCREEPQAGKPPRKVYSITAAGRAVFIESLTEPPAPDVFRSEFLLIAMCGDVLDRDAVRSAVDHRCEQLASEIAHLQGVHDSCDHPGTRWVVNYGLTCSRASLAYLKDNRSEIEALAGTARVQQAAE